MKEFDDILNTIDILLSPKGCSWDRDQTLESMKGFLLEESQELIDAIDKKDKNNILEELGDLFFLILLISRKADQYDISLKDIINEANNKLIRRHPHVFEEYRDLNSKEVLKLWNNLKKKGL